MNNQTSAAQWQPQPVKVVATTPSWRDQGYDRKYLHFVAGAEDAIALWAKQNDGTRFVFRTDSGFSFSLFWLVCSYPFLKKAVDISALRGNAPGVDGKTFYLQFQCREWTESEIRRLKRSLRDGNYRPDDLAEVTIQIGSKPRVLHIPTIIDRVVERAIVLVLSALYEAVFHPSSFGFRRGISPSHALGCLFSTCKRLSSYVIGKIDLKDAFDRIPHQSILEVLAIRVRDQQLPNLITKIVKRQGWKNKQNKVNVGLAQGGPLSPLLFNVYLDHLFDKVLTKKYPNITFIRWADDILIVSKNHDQFQNDRNVAIRVLSDAGLEVNKEKTFGQAAAADLKAGETLNYMGFVIEATEEGELRLKLGDDAWESLLGQLTKDIYGERPNVGTDGRRVFLKNQVTFTIGSWLEAYAGGIRTEDWPETRRAIKGLFMGSPGSNPQSGSPKPCSLSSEAPSSRTLNDLYERARRHWEVRLSSTEPERAQRNAKPTNRSRQQKPECIADGADMVPAPSVFFEPYDRRSAGPDQVEWRAMFVPLDGAE